EILEKQRDEAQEKLSKMEEASSQLLKEIDMLEVQFHNERSCRESAEALVLKVTKENKVLKRRSQALLPLIPKLPENLSALNFDLEEECSSDLSTPIEEEPDLKSHAQIRELQSSVDQLLGEKIQLCEQIEVLKKEKEELKDQCALEVEEKEAILRKLSKQSRTMNKIKRVSQLVTEEFTEMSQKLEMEQGLRHHAELFAHQVLVKQRHSQCQSLALEQNTEMDTQLQQALEQVVQISKALEEIRLHHQQQSQSATEEFNALAELQVVRAHLENSEKERVKMEYQLKDSQKTLAVLQEEVKQLQDGIRIVNEAPTPEFGQSNEENTIPSPPAPPPVLSTVPTDPLNALRNRKKAGSSTTDSKNLVLSMDMKARAVDEMMERIKRGIVLKPALKTPQVNSSFSKQNISQDQSTEKRKSALLELQGMLDSIKRPSHKRVMSRKRISHNVGEAELQLVLQRRRQAIGDDKGSHSPPKDPAITSSPWTAESGNAPVLRRLKQNQESASEAIMWEDS
uniref:Shootin-1 n=1 Tax=Electrophorus electricus TaxID=8005 RepID=A0A4W4DPB9_ELEEL